jgi:DNA-binding HxlR family transcriptional regulator/putative sterol carrier protein
VSRRSYGQYCALARALDLVGDRWTLLIARELLFGPQRFTDLLAGLPGIGRNLLAARLRELEDEGVIRRRTLPPPAASRIYELTEDGRELGLTLGPLTRWGAKRLGTRRPGEYFRPAWIAWAMANSADREAARGVRETYQYEVDDDPFHVRVDDGAIEPGEGRAEQPDLVVTLDTDTLVDILSWTLSPLEAMSSGRLTIDGSRAAFQRSLAILGGGHG